MKVARRCGGRGQIKCQGRRQEIVKDDFGVLRLGKGKCISRKHKLGRLILVVGVVFVNGNWSFNWKCLLAEGNKAVDLD